MEGAAGDAAERAEDGRRAEVRRGAPGSLLTLRLLAGRRAQRRESCVRRARIRNVLLLAGWTPCMLPERTSLYADASATTRHGDHHVCNSRFCPLELTATARSNRL